MIWCSFTSLGRIFFPLSTMLEKMQKCKNVKFLIEKDQNIHLNDKFQRFPSKSKISPVNEMDKSTFCPCISFYFVHLHGWWCLIEVWDDFVVVSQQIRGWNFLLIPRWEVIFYLLKNLLLPPGYLMVRPYILTMMHCTQVHGCNALQCSSK